ncbi:hypothetical protein Tco_1285027 [Tanacetum coccineum]
MGGDSCAWESVRFRGGGGWYRRVLLLVWLGIVILGALVFVVVGGMDDWVLRVGGKGVEGELVGGGGGGGVEGVCLGLGVWEGFLIVLVGGGDRRGGFELWNEVMRRLKVYWVWYSIAVVGVV